MQSTIRKRVGGFTVVEIMLVVGIIGLMALIAVPSFLKARVRAQTLRFINDLRIASAAFEQYSLDVGTYPPDDTPAEVPPGMADYLQKMRWTEPTSIGGQWDWDYMQWGVKAGVSVYRPSRDDQEMMDLDDRIDDGNLDTGKFHRRNDGFIYVVEP